MNPGVNLPPRDPQVLELDGKDVLGDMLILLGLVCIVGGSWFIYHPLGLIVGGFELLFVGHVLEARVVKK